MGKQVDKLIANYMSDAGILLEQDPMAPTPPPGAGGDPAMMAGGPAGAAPAGGIPPVPPLDKDEEDVEKQFEGEEGKQNYLNAIKDMKDLLSIDPEELSDDDKEVFMRKIRNKRQAVETHETLRDIIQRYPQT